MSEIAAPTSAVVRHYRRSNRRRRWRAVAVGLFAFAALAVVIRLTIRDRWLAFASFHYATPPAICMGLFAVAAGLAWRGRQKKLFNAAAITAIACAFWTYQSAFVRPATERSADSGTEEVCVLFWNMSSGEFGLEHVISLIESHDADVVTLVEARQHTTWTQRWWAQSFPQYRFCAFDHGLVLLSKHRLTDIAGGKLDKLGKYGLARIQTPRHDYCFILVDIGHYVHSSRGPALAALHDLVTETTDRNLVVLGDFNTPPDSVHFAALRDNLVNAFEVAGAGYGTTWPIPLPVLQLDQIWLRPPLVAADCALGWTWVSDHRPVMARIKINEE